MKLLLFGATGRTGSHVLKRALNEGVSVTAFVRSKSKIDRNMLNSKHLTIVEGDALNEEDTWKAFRNKPDAVFSALSTDKNNVLSGSIPIIVKQMENNGIDRFVSIGTAGILDARSEPGRYRFESAESRRKSTAAAEDHLHAYLTLKKSRLNWTIFCPTYLPDGESTGKIMFNKNILPANVRQITVGNTAWFAFHEMFNCEFYGTRIGLGEYS